MHITKESQSGLTVGTLANDLIAGDIIGGFTKTSTLPGFIVQIIMIIIGVILTIIGCFLPVLLPEVAAAAIENEAEAALLDLAQTRLLEALLKPLQNIGKSANLWGIIPGSIVSASAGLWAKIVDAEV